MNEDILKKNFPLSDSGTYVSPPVGDLAHYKKILQ